MLLYIKKYDNNGRTYTHDTRAAIFSRFTYSFGIHQPLSYAQLVRILRDRYMEDPSDINVAQIENLRKRLNLTRMMQVFGIASLFFCVVTMFLIYIGLFLLSIYIFGLALLLLIASLGVSLREIQISTRALDIYLSTMEGKLKH